MPGSEAAAKQDVVVLTNIQESYYNITHQTLEMCRMAAMDPSITHLLKVDDDSYVHMTRLMGRLKALPREKLFLGYIEKAGRPPLSACAFDDWLIMLLAPTVTARCASMLLLCIVGGCSETSCSLLLGSIRSKQNSQSICGTYVSQTYWLV